MLTVISDPDHHKLISTKDRKQLAKNLGLTLKKFDQLVSSANYAYSTIKNLGPFYGQEHLNEPTFRISAHPIVLSKKANKTLELLGHDLLALGKALPKLPEKYKLKLGDDLDYKLPPTWRIDTILDADGNLHVNEIEGQDGANALMMAEQLAYNLKSLEESTAAKLIPVFKQMSLNKGKRVTKLALVKVAVATNPLIANARRFINYVQELSEKTIQIDLFDEEELRTKQVRPNWGMYHGVLNETSLSPTDYIKLGVRPEQLIAAGTYNALVNKGVFGLVFESKLQTFWEKEIGKSRLERLQKLLAETSFIESKKSLNEARKAGKVVKVSWAGSDTRLINQSKGVAIPLGEIEQSSEDRWDFLIELLGYGHKIIAQEFIEPAKVPAFLRKKETNLEYVEWHNRICVKYVPEADPNLDSTSNVFLTAVEVTLGPDIIPAGRKCAFTAGAFMGDFRK